VNTLQKLQRRMLQKLQRMLQRFSPKNTSYNKYLTKFLSARIALLSPFLTFAPPHSAQTAANDRARLFAYSAQTPRSPADPQTTTPQA
jgi:hypothetical protein